MIAGKFGRLDLSRPRPGGETSTDPHTPSDSNRLNNKMAMNAAMITLIVSYSLLISMLSIVIPLTLFLLGDASYNHEGQYVAGFHFYVYIVALLALFYLSISAHMQRRQGKKETFATFGQARIRQGQHAPAVYEGTEGVNFFLRMGLVAFAIGGCLLEGFRIMQYAEQDSQFVWHCFGSRYLTLSLFRFFFYILQAFILFKYHKMVLNYQHLLVRLSIAHLISTNITTWSMTVILEAVESYRHGLAASSGVHRRAAGSDPGHGAPAASVHSNTTISCIKYPKTLATMAAPYLFPFLIEYSLLAAAILYNMFGKVGHKEYEEVKEMMEEKQQEEARKRIKRQSVAIPTKDSQCDKAHTGLFLGIITFTILGIACCFFLYFKTTGGLDFVPGTIHVSADIIVDIIAGLAIIPAFYQMKRLHFTGLLENALDQNLLVLALFGYYILLSAMVIAALSQSQTPGAYGFWARVIGAMCLIDILQISLQVSFIGDGLRRKAVTQEDAHHKPGRSFITFLLICNLGLWLVNTFMLKESYAFQLFSGYYGDLAWIIILNCTLPLAIYYRFHASVCLSEIWLHAYRKVSLEKIVQQDMASCGKIL